MDSHAITRWEASSGQELIITVVSKPLDLAKKFVWMYHTTNHYGQGAKRCWWHWEEGGVKPSVAVYDKEGQDLLTALVYAHDPLQNLVQYFYIPPLEKKV